MKEMSPAVEYFRQDLDLARGERGREHVALIAVAWQLIRIADSLEKIGYAAEVWSHPAYVLKGPIGKRFGDSQI